jgi:hypothetical protein
MGKDKKYMITFEEGEHADVKALASKQGKSIKEWMAEAIKLKLDTEKYPVTALLKVLKATDMEITPISLDAIMKKDEICRFDITLKQDGVVFLANGSVDADLRCSRIAFREESSKS